MICVSGILDPSLMGACQVTFHSYLTVQLYMRMLNYIDQSETSFQLVF